MKIKNIIRVAVYLSVFIISGVLVLRMQQDIKRRLAENIISVTSEYKLLGKPVVVTEIVKRDVDIFLKTSMVPVSEGVFESYATSHFKDKVSEGQVLYCEENQVKRSGEIKNISSDIDLDSGLYRIEYAFDDKNILKNERKVVHIYYKTLKDVLIVPNDIVEIEGEKRFIWRVKNGLAQRTKVVIGEQVFGDVIIKEGLMKGDEVVFEGHTLLKENDKIRNISENKGAKQ